MRTAVHGASVAPADDWAHCDSHTHKVEQKHGNSEERDVHARGVGGAPVLAWMQKRPRPPGRQHQLRIHSTPRLIRVTLPPPLLHDAPPLPYLALRLEQAGRAQPKFGLEAPQSEHH